MTTPPGGELKAPVADGATFIAVCATVKVEEQMGSNMFNRVTLLFSLLLTTVACTSDFDIGSSGEAERRITSDWPEYGGGGGRKYADLELIGKENVGALELAWTYRTGDVDTVFQTTPVLVGGQLVFCSPFNKVIALDPQTGGELWSYDPQIDPDLRPANEFNCRAVTPWRSSGNECPSRIFMATNDARLIALDAGTGEVCPGFGTNGEVPLDEGVGDIRWPGEYQVTSPPVTAGNLVIVGSAVSDGNRLTAPSGVVRAFDALNGDLVWAFDLAPPDFNYDSGPVSTAGYALGTPNVWAPMSVDEGRDMVFLPTGNPAPDYFRPNDINMAHYGSSVVALRASTGEVLWHFNTVIRDFWDFDVPSQPVLADLTIDGQNVPALIQATKMGHIFVLHRETGEPVVEVDYREVPRHGPLADRLSDVQPYPPEAFQVSREYVEGSALLGLCDETDAGSVIGPLYTPITEKWTIGLPSNMGATNWGGVSVDENRGLIVVNTNSVPFRTKIIARKDAEDLLEVLMDPATDAETRMEYRRRMNERFDLSPGTEVAPQNGTDYMMARHTYLDSTIGIPCAGTPMAELMVIDIAKAAQTWRQPHGTVRDIVYLPLRFGMPGMGGTMTTSTGLIFIGAAAEKALRAYDVDTGEELWHHRLPFPANATPMSYSVETDTGAKQFVVVAAGGDARGGIGGEGDYLVAFSLPD